VLRLVTSGPVQSALQACRRRDWASTASFTSSSSSGGGAGEGGDAMRHLATQLLAVAEGAAGR
jgi:hypothetical protein